MLCPACGFINAEQALECSRCRKILDPIAELVTVDAARHPVGATTFVEAGTIQLPPLPGQPAAPPAAPEVSIPTKFKPAKRQVVSPDPDFLVSSEGALNLRNLVLKPELDPGLLAAEVKCPRCGKVVPRSKLALDPAGKIDEICRSCYNRVIRSLERAPLRARLYSVLGGLLLGGIAAIILVMYAKWYGLSATQKEINWHWGLFIGVIIGLAVRLGSLNRPSAAIQSISLALAVVTQGVFLYACLNTISGPNLPLTSVFDAMQALRPGLQDYGMIGLGLLLAFVLPSALVGGRKETVFTVKD